MDLEGDLLDKFIICEANVESNLNTFKTKLDKDSKEMKYEIKNTNDQLNQEHGEF